MINNMSQLIISCFASFLLLEIALKEYTLGQLPFSNEVKLLRTLRATAHITVNVDLSGDTSSIKQSRCTTASWMPVHLFLHHKGQMSGQLPALPVQGIEPLPTIDKKKYKNQRRIPWDLHMILPAVVGCVAVSERSIAILYREILHKSN